MAYLPTCKAMIFCEDVLPGPRDTGNVHLMNVFSAIRPRSGFPYRFPHLCLFLQLTDGEGHVEGQVLVRQASSDRVVFDSQTQMIEFRDRLQMKWVVFHINDCPFPEPGLYWIEFHVD